MNTTKLTYNGQKYALDFYGSAPTFEYVNAVLVAMGAVSPTAVSYVCWLRELGTEEYTVLLVAGKMVGEIIEGKDREFEVGISEYDASDRLLGSSMVSGC